MGGLSNAELHSVFADWNKGELESFLIEITADIFTVKDDQPGGEGEKGYLVDYVLDKTGSKGTGEREQKQLCRAVTLRHCVPCCHSTSLRAVQGWHDEAHVTSGVIGRTCQVHCGVQ